jgi:hypothetical protein
MLLDIFWAKLEKVVIDKRIGIGFGISSKNKQNYCIQNYELLRQDCQGEFGGLKSN